MITLSIIHEAQNRDVCAQRILFDCYGKMLYRLARRYLPDTVKAEDAVAKAVFIIFQKIHTCRFVAIPPFEMWMKRIVVNECLKILKKEKRFEIVMDAEEDACYVDDATIENLSAEEIFRVIESLPDGYRTVFNLYEIEGYSHSEIAELLGISTGTSKSQLSKAKSLLQKRIIELDPVYAKRKVI
ncbi:sigma-70 family RNA polymerase sigma factor [Dyadobacter flavalbus]|uniref:Sigma-70 family RNA polymerase sigma factor n=1 Tax=Dyadobacter flavalbus TaxID=2579942 RepID=A0A5M8QVZ9_9BACT|nr:sigma-70 family RNA polymerase sigma factor [Dyadobacter flavalbus]KAA6438974.1 sigma-70 family RNA polymerase sigma factor [Dyadobacter flavalbus]